MIRKAPIPVIMTEAVISLEKNDSLERAEHLFKTHHIRHLPVISSGTVVGMLSYTDLLRLSFADITDDDESDVDVMVYKMFSVNQVMNKNVVTVKSSDSIKEVAEILAVEEFHAVPVVDQSNKLIGIVTTTDLIKYLINEI